jgi:hypothetical protein
MSQYITGTAKVLASDHNRVVLLAGVTTGNVEVGDAFHFDGEAVIFFVASIIDTLTFDLDRDYTGSKAFDTFFPYVVTRDFSVRHALALPGPGDRNTWSALRQGTTRIDEALGLVVEILTNKSGGQLVAGDVVAVDTANDQSVALGDTLASIRPGAVCLDSVVGANLVGRFVLAGRVQAKAQGSIARGRYVRKSATTKALEDAGVTMDATTYPPSGTIGVSLAAASGGFCVVLLYGPGAVAAFGTSGPYRVVIADSAEIHTFTTETNFNKIITVAAGRTNVAGTIIRARAFGKVSTTGTPTLTLRLRFAGTVVMAQVSVEALTALTDHPWMVEGMAIVRTTGASASVQTFGGFGHGRYDATRETVEGTQIAGAVTRDLTAGWDVTASAQWTASSASNKLTQQGLAVWIEQAGGVVS